MGQAKRAQASNARRWVAEMDVPYKLYKGDCLEIMPTLEAGSVDAIITDLPYGTTACEWDSIIPLAPMWEQVKRVLKPSGVFVTTASQPFTSAFVMSNPKWFRYELIYKKTKATGFLDANKKPLKSHENILVCSRKTHIYNPQMSKAETIHKRGLVKRKGTDVYGKERESFIQLETGLRFPKSVVEINNADTSEIEHPTQKPVALYEYLINTYTNFGETVLDIAMGSGTTIIAAMKTGRKSIGIERDPKYFAIAEKRIQQAAQQPALFHATQQSVQRTGGESGQQNLFSAGEVLPAKVTRQSTRR